MNDFEDIEEVCISDTLIPISECLNDEFSREIVIKEKEIEIEIFLMTPSFNLTFFKCWSKVGFSKSDLLQNIYNGLKNLDRRLDLDGSGGLWEQIFMCYVIEEIYYYPQEKKVSVSVRHRKI